MSPSSVGTSGCLLAHQKRWAPASDRYPSGGPGSAGACRISPALWGISGYLLSHQSSHLLACLAARSGKSRISRMTRVGFFPS